MSNMMAQIAYQKHCMGDSITDEELLEGYSAFRKAGKALIGLGPTFRLTCNECIRVEHAFLSYIKARGLQEPLEGCAAPTTPAVQTPLGASSDDGQDPSAVLDNRTLAAYVNDSKRNK